MTEDYLQYCFREKIFGNAFTTSTGEPLSIIDFGTHNINAGPDFLNCKIKYQDRIWAGHIEFHINASDWFKHKHQFDPNYENVIAHLVFKHDKDVSSGNYLLPTVELANQIDEKHFEQYRKLFGSTNWIPCETHLINTPVQLSENMRLDLVLQRLERKSNEILAQLKSKNGDRKKTFYQSLAKTLGGKVNGASFEHLIQLLDFRWFAKVNYDPLKIDALIFGLAGFLEQDANSEYQKRLKEEFLHLKHLFRLQPMSFTNWKYSRMRPNGYPDIRLAQLSAIFQMNIPISNVKMSKSTQSPLKNLTLNEFWKEHYHFNKETKVKSFQLSKGLIDSININTIAPYQFAMGKLLQQQKQKNEVVESLGLIAPEKNSIIKKWKELRINVNSSFDSQALIELKNEMCENKKCLFCDIGKTILKT
ncbi:DUF2851 family protein [Crocinitomix catalasitica]|uniref:DUF2851 family protein n=1 Tax=Crocinitomix catalasitica TaxID=184607 RepID=UPI0004830C7A|nr:DUF2851 family protein [Crocinitomix catalasitica]